VKLNASMVRCKSSKVISASTLAQRVRGRDLFFMTCQSCNARQLAVRR
jgi:hypothetical protein